MLTDIYIDNFTLVDRLHLNLALGLSVLSGETGAGKSILVDAIELALGARADSQVIRTGQSRAQITLCFDITTSEVVQQWLTEHDFDAHECIISRVIDNKGKSKSTINHRPCSLAKMRELAHHLVHIHSQHQSHTLLERHRQQTLLDAFALQTENSQALSKCCQRWKSTQDAIKALEDNAIIRQQQLTFLDDQLKHLETLQIQPDEVDQLHREHRRLHTANDIINDINQTIGHISDHSDYNAEALIALSLRTIEPHLETMPALAEPIELIKSAHVQLNEASMALNALRENQDLSPERLTWVEDRLSRLHDVARKHHHAPERLDQLTQIVSDQIETLQRADQAIIDLIKQKTQLEMEYHQLAQNIQLARTKAVKKINIQITRDMQALGMEGGAFEIKLIKTETEQPCKDGYERVEFWVKTNPGQPFLPLNKVVSGGELSRISLAIQNTIAEQEPVPTFIFDEVDVGIGGKTAEVVGKLLHRFAKNRQVFCITHLAQVAACGDHHFLVIKSKQKNSTATHIKTLDQNTRISELARMISGATISQQTLAHAKQLLHKETAS